MKALMLYFIGSTIKNRLQHLLDIQTCSIEETPVDSLPPFDLLFLGFPVYETDSPANFQRYVCALPPGHGRGLFIYCANGGFPGNTLYRNFFRLTAKGYVPPGHLSVGMMDTGGIAFMAKDSWPVRFVRKRDYHQVRA